MLQDQHPNHDLRRGARTSTPTTQLRRIDTLPKDEAVIEVVAQALEARWPQALGSEDRTVSCDAIHQ
jgi:hypothetical protein